jgi:hypothetical protein
MMLWNQHASVSFFSAIVAPRKLRAVLSVNLACPLSMQNLREKFSALNKTFLPEE